MKIAIIVGSIRLNRQSIKVGKYLSGLLDRMNVNHTLLDLIDYPFPVMEERFRFLDEPAEWMTSFGNTLDEADGIIIVTPEYNGSYSGALKNALDYFKPEYVSIIDGFTLNPIMKFQDHTYAVVCTAVWAGEIRLIDNMVIKKP